MIRSTKYLAAAKNQPCTLRFTGICLDPMGQGHETTVFAHFRYGKGMGQKAHDFDGSDSCANCHRFLDEGWVGKVGWFSVVEHMLRGLERTLENRIRRGIIEFHVTVEKPKTSKPKAKRSPSRPIPQRADPWPVGRKLQSKPLRPHEIEESTK